MAQPGESIVGLFHAIQRFGRSPTLVNAWKIPQKVFMAVRSFLWENECRSFFIWRKWGT
jgi:hypothetical protein